MWLKIGTTELRVLNKKHEKNAIHKRKYEYNFEPTIDFENYTFEYIKSPPALSLSDIMNAAFVQKKENLILYGYVAAGKTYLAIATGIAACDAGFKTRFWLTATLVNALTEAKKTTNSIAIYETI
jgi:DNA replication protein DnaC